MTGQNPYALAPIRDVEEPRCACILLLDVSGSMSGDRIQELNKALKIFATEVANDPLASKRVEAAIVSFGSDVRVEADFEQARDFRPVELTTRGATSMGLGVVTALNMVENRKAYYKQHGVDYYRPWIFLLTDGGATDHGGTEWREAVKRVRSGESNRAHAFFSVGVQGASFSHLAELSERSPVQLKGLKFSELFQWLSASMTQISASNPDDSTPLPSIEGWGEMPSR